MGKFKDSLNEEIDKNILDSIQIKLSSKIQKNKKIQVTDNIPLKETRDLAKKYKFQLLGKLTSPFQHRESEIWISLDSKRFIQIIDDRHPSYGKTLSRNEVNVYGYDNQREDWRILGSLELGSRNRSSIGNTYYKALERVLSS